MSIALFFILGYSPTLSHSSIYNVLTIASTNLKHSVIQLATCYHVLYNYEELAFSPPTESQIRNTRDKIRTLRKRITELKATVRKVPVGTDYTSIEYLRSKSASKWFQNVCLLTMVAVIGGFVTLRFVIKN